VTTKYDKNKKVAIAMSLAQYMKTGGFWPKPRNPMDSKYSAHELDTWGKINTALIYLVPLFQKKSSHKNFNMKLVCFA